MRRYIFPEYQNRSNNKAVKNLEFFPPCICELIYLILSHKKDTIRICLEIAIPANNSFFLLQKHIFADSDREHI